MTASSRLFLILFLFFVLAMLATQASASVFVIGDQDDKFTVSFPDSWAMSHNQKPDDKLTILAPNDGSDASCRVRVRDDQRFTVYPASSAQSIQQANYGAAFWDKYLAQYDDVSVVRVVHGTPMGWAQASSAEATYTSTLGSSVQKRAMMRGGVFQGRAFIVECAATAEGFPQWQGTFANIMNSFAPMVTGNGAINSYYRDFPNDPILIINRQAQDDRTLYY